MQRFLKAFSWICNGPRPLEDVVFLTPHLHQHPGFPERPEIRRIQALIPELAVEAFAFAILPRGIRLTQQGALAEYDRLDVLAMAVTYWVEQMARDVDRAIADEKERRLKDALENFMDHVLGHKPKGDTWM